MIRRGGLLCASSLVAGRRSFLVRSLPGAEPLPRTRTARTLQDPQLSEEEKRDAKLAGRRLFEICDNREGEALCSLVDDFFAQLEDCEPAFVAEVASVRALRQGSRSIFSHVLISLLCSASLLDGAVPIGASRVRLPPLRLR